MEASPENFEITGIPVSFLEKTFVGAESKVSKFWWMNQVTICGARNDWPILDVFFYQYICFAYCYKTLISVDSKGRAIWYLVIVRSNVHFVLAFCSCLLVEAICHKIIWLKYCRKKTVFRQSLRCR